VKKSQYNTIRGQAGRPARVGVNILVGCACIVILGFGSCSDSKPLYSELAEIGGAGWAINDSLKFGFEVIDTAALYHLLLEVKHDAEYDWENVYVQILTAFPDDSVKVDVLSLELADGYGGWLGHCSGDKCALEIPLQQRVRFPLPGQYGLTFVQYMREEVVPGILGLRLSVVPVEE
jgi:gliding motility-associated lipoprotein GldH